jgi:hypothetical protein
MKFSSALRGGHDFVPALVAAARRCVAEADRLCNLTHPKAMPNKSVRVELVETLSLQVNNLPRTSTSSVRTEECVQRRLQTQ